MTETFENKSSKSVKLSWIIVIGVSFFGLGYYVRESYVKFNVTPEILVNERYARPNEIPFPAVTICPPQIINIKHLNISSFIDKVRQNKAVSLDDQNVLVTGGQICNNYYNFMAEVFGNKEFNENVVEILSRVSPHINETLSKCLISGNDGCEKLFVRSLTFRGYCFTFNMLDHDSIFKQNISVDFDVYKHNSSNSDIHSNEYTPTWTLEDGYLTKENFMIPLKCTEAEFLQITSKINKSEFSNFCINRLDAYLVIVHLPNEIPTHVHAYTYFEFKKHKAMRITASVKNIDHSLKAFPIGLRNCLYKDEKQLRFFRAYTMSNCEQECMANFTLVKCGCVMFSSPRTDYMKVCKFTDAKCFSYTYNKWPSSYYEDGENLKNFPEYPCNCMPACTDIKYIMLNEHSFDRKIFERNDSEIARIKISFTGGQIIQTTNYVTYQLQNFVSDIGGLAGLFLGFSLLSLFELTLKTIDFIKKMYNCLTLNRKNKNKQTRHFQRTVLNVPVIDENIHQCIIRSSDKVFTVLPQNFRNNRVNAYE